jgi:hypothetical protein
MAGLVLPLVDPPVFALISAGTGGMEMAPALGVLLIALVNGLVLWRLSEGVWGLEARKKRVAIGLAVSAVLAVAFGIAELMVTLLIVCSNQACFS